jgi:DNA-binding transcriptional ArsR family regulator
MNIAQRNALINSDKLSSTTAHVFQTLLNYCHGQKTTCFPGVHDIMILTKLSRRSVQKHLRILEKEGLILTTERFQGKRQISSLYKIVKLTEEIESYIAQEREAKYEKMLGTGGNEKGTRKSPGGSPRQSRARQTVLTPSDPTPASPIQTVST